METDERVVDEGEAEVAGLEEGQGEEGSKTTMGI